MEAGIKQGCPASGPIFALALDPFLRMILTRNPRPLGTLGAFADDIAVVASELFDTFLELARDFSLFEAASGLKLNPKKTKFVPIGQLSIESIRKHLEQKIPDWSEIRIGHYGKLPGGPLARSG
jgi:hypothetical protein